MTLTVAPILAHSSNVGAVTIGLEVGAEQVQPLDQPLRLRPADRGPVPGRGAGIVPALDEYSGSTMGNLPIGQGLSVTPMQMVAGYDRDRQRRLPRRPQLIERIDGEDGRTSRGASRVIKARSPRRSATMLEGVLAPGGTASEVSVPGYTLAGKTGTAQVAENGTYSKTKYVASFIGFAPAQDPRLLVAVIVDEPQGEIYGGSVAAPAFGEIAAFALPYLGVPAE